MKVLFLVLPVFLLISCGNKSPRPSAKVITVTSIEKEESKKILNKLAGCLGGDNPQSGISTDIFKKLLSQERAENCSVASYSIIDDDYLSHLAVHCSITDELGVTNIEFDINYIKNEKVIIKFKFDKGEVLLNNLANYINEKTKNDGISAEIDGINIQSFINEMNQNSSVEIGNEIKKYVALLKEEKKEIDIKLEEKNPGDYTLKLSHKNNEHDVNAMFHIMLKDNPSRIKFDMLMSFTESLLDLDEEGKNYVNRLSHDFYLAIKNK